MRKTGGHIYDQTDRKIEVLIDVEEFTFGAEIDGFKWSGHGTVGSLRESINSWISARQKLVWEPAIIVTTSGKFAESWRDDAFRASLKLSRRWFAKNIRGDTVSSAWDRFDPETGKDERSEHNRLEYGLEMGRKGELGAILPYSDGLWNSLHRIANGIVGLREVIADASAVGWTDEAMVALAGYSFLDFQVVGSKVMKLYE